MQYVNTTIRFSRRRIVVYLLILGWLLLVPVFRSNANHFGWGFFPMTVSCLLVPFIAVGIAIDLVLRIIEVRAKRPDLPVRMAAIALPFFALLVAGFSLIKLFGENQ